MNKDNKKLTELYNIIQEAFEPDSSPESNVVGPAKELFNLLKEIADKTIRQEIRDEPLVDEPLVDERGTYEEYYDDLDDVINKVIKKITSKGYESFLYFYDGDPDVGVEIEDGEEYAIIPGFGTDAVDVGHEAILDTMTDALRIIHVYARTLDILYDILKANFNRRLDVKTLKQVLITRDS